ncbi:MAG: hypothetical protein ACO3L1_00155 [Flavobacteriaceae bacterium]
MNSEEAVAFVKTSLANSLSIKDVSLSGGSTVRVVVDFRGRDMAVLPRIHLASVGLKNASSNQFSLVVVPYDGTQFVESNLGVSKPPNMRVVTAVGAKVPE